MGKPLWAMADPPPAPPVVGWHPLAELVPRDREVSPQGVVILDDGCWVSSQADTSDNLTLTRYSRSGQRKDELRIPGAGHGDRIRANGQHVGVFVKGIWCLIPWQTGTLSAATAVSKYRSTYGLLPFGARDWFQGEITDLDGWAVRLYGPSIVDGKKRPNVPANLEFYRPPSSTVVHREEIGQLGRVGLTTKGAPYDDRLEPEGLSFGQIDGQPTLIVGIVTGRYGHGGFTHRIYGRLWHGAP